MEVYSKKWDQCLLSLLLSHLPVKIVISCLLDVLFISTSSVSSVFHSWCMVELRQVDHPYSMVLLNPTPSWTWSLAPNHFSKIKNLVNLLLPLTNDTEDRHCLGQHFHILKWDLKSSHNVLRDFMEFSSQALNEVITASFKVTIKILHFTTPLA